MKGGGMWIYFGSLTSNYEFWGTGEGTVITDTLRLNYQYTDGDITYF